MDRPVHSVSRPNQCSFLRAWLALLLVMCGIALPSAAWGAVGDPRPFLQQVGNQSQVAGMAVAPNGHTFIMLPDGQLVVFGADQVARAPLTLPQFKDARGIATWGGADEEDTTTRIYVLTSTSIVGIDYDTEARVLRENTLSTYSFPAAHTPVAITISPAAGAEIFVCGNNVVNELQLVPLAVFLPTTKNFVAKLPATLATADYKTWGQSRSFASNGTIFTSRANNQVFDLTADLGGNVYVSGQWDAVYANDSIFYDFFYARSISWRIADAGLAGISTTVQSSIRSYFTIFGGFFFSNVDSNGNPLDAENRTGYIVKFDASLAPQKYTHTTDQVPNFFFWWGNYQSNVSSYRGIKFAANNFLYAAGNWSGYSAYGNENTPFGQSNIQVLKFDSNLNFSKRAKAVSNGTEHPAHSIDVSPAGKVFVSGLVQDGATTFVGTQNIEVGGRGVFIGGLDVDLTNWANVNRSNSPAPAAFQRSFTRWNPKSMHAQVAGAFTTGQLSLGPASAPALLPSVAVPDSVDYYTLTDANGALINQINVTVRSEFVLGTQITTKVGDNAPTPLATFDPVTREGSVGLLSDSAGITVTVSVPPVVYYDSLGKQVFPTFNNGNEVAPSTAVSRHICTGFSVSGEATTGATNTYTFQVSRDTKVIFNWRSEHALQITSSVVSDLGLPQASGFALGNPEPAVNKHWIAANQPVTTFIDNATNDPATYGRRFRVTGFDATGSALVRPAPLPPLPAPRVLGKTRGTTMIDSPTVALPDGATLDIGWVVTGPGIPAGATIVDFNASELTLSEDATASGTVELTFDNSKIQNSLAVTLTKGSADVTIGAPAGIKPGWLVSGPGIPAGTTVQSVTDTTHVTLSNPAIPLKLSSRTTAPIPVPAIEVPTEVTTGSENATVPGFATISAGMVVEGPQGNPAFPDDTTVNNVTDVTTALPTRITNQDPVAYVAYTTILSVGTPVSGTRVPIGTLIDRIDEEATVISTRLTDGTNTGTIAGNAPLTATNIPVRGSGIESTPETTVVSITPVQRTALTGLNGGSDVADVTIADGGGSPPLLPVNSVLSGPNIPPGTFITGNSLLSISRTGNTTQNSPTVTGINTGSLRVGDTVAGTGIQSDTVIQSIGTNLVTLSKNADDTGTGVSLTFARRRLTLSASMPVAVGGDVNVTYTTAQTVTFSQNAKETGDRALQYITDLKLTMTQDLEDTTTLNLNYTTEKTLEFSNDALRTDTLSLRYFIPTTSGATTVKVPSTASLLVGMSVSGPGIPDGTVITAKVDATTITISQPATEAGRATLEYFSPNVSITFSSNFGSFAFPSLQARQQVPEWLMSGPATIAYRWSTQYHVMVSTSVQAARDQPEVRTGSAATPIPAGAPGFGSGEHWYDAGSRVFVGAKFGGGTASRQLNGWLNATMPAFPSDKGSVISGALSISGAPGGSASFYYMDVSNLQFPVRVLWDYGGTIHYVSVPIGNYFKMSETPTAPTLPPGAVTSLNNTPPDRRTVVEGPPGSTGDQMALWDPVVGRLFPVRPGKFLLEYGSIDDPLIVEVTSSFPIAPHFTHLTHPELPGIVLDPSLTDAIALQQLAYSSGNATADAGSFLSTQDGKAVIVFTQRDPADTAPANGDQTKETLLVKVVETKQWESALQAVPGTVVPIGERLTRTLPPPSLDVLNTGFIVHKNARYNAEIYDRSKIVGSGPIIPVNQHFTGVSEDDLIVIWFAKPDLTTGIVWTHSVEKFAPQWPANPPRIVMASRLGSEGKDANGDDQLVFTRDRYANVKIYHQPVRSLPGYNPNEEHALIAPSFKFTDQANPPPAAYALQSGGLNRLKNPAQAVDLNYTSDPYVLVQYEDTVEKEAKMAVYSIQAEDPAPELNPYIDPRTEREFRYTFFYDMVAAEPVQPPYPLARVIGLVASPETFGVNTSPARVYWEDYNGVPYAAGQGGFSSFFYYRMTDEFWHGEGAAALSPGTSIPFGNASGSSLIRVSGTVAHGSTAQAFTGGNTAPQFAVGDNFLIATGSSPNPVKVTIAGTAAADFVAAVLGAFPDGEVAARVTLDGAVQLIAYGGATLTVTDDPAQGSPLVKAGFLTALNPPAVQTVSLINGDVAGTLFASGDNFTIDTALPPASSPVTVTLAGSTAQAFVDAVNAAFPGGEVVASLSAQQRIELRGEGIDAVTLADGTGSPLAKAGFKLGQTAFPVQEVRYFAKWPANPPILKAGETLTFAGGEYRADHPTAPGLPGVIGWAVGEVIFDSANPFMKTTAGGVNAFRDYTARLISPLEIRRVSIGTPEDAAAVATIIQPATGITRAIGTVWKFTNLPASLARRLFYDPLTRELGLNGFVNDVTLGDSTLTATPPPVYVLEPNIITPSERDEMLAIPQLATNFAWRDAVQRLYALSRNPNQLTNGSDAGQAPYYVGLTQAYSRDPATGEVVVDANGNPVLEPNSAMPAKVLGPGLALVPSPSFLHPNNPLPEGYVTLVENNDEDIGGPVTLRVVKVSRNDRYRGAIKTILSDNVFSEQLTLRHTADFGGNADDIVYQWFYREEDGTEAPVPPGAAWQLLADDSNSEPRGLGRYQIELKGNPILLLADQLFFLRYRHKDEAPAGGPNSTNWAETKWEEYGAEFAGAANSRPGAYQPQLAQGWVKRVLDRINPYEARFNDFRNNSAPATYSSMILEAGQRFEGPVALNPDKNVVENVGLIELYETILDRGRSLSIDLSSPVVTGGINNALLLAATRLTDLYMLLGNEAYSDAQDPTIGFGSTSVEYGSAAPSIFSFQNQQPNLLEEELALLRGVSQSYGRPVYNRLFWNFTKSEGEVAYAMNYNIVDHTKDGFIDENDARFLYPQGHGDAWGHYLTAIKSQYRLLQHPFFNWVSRSEFYNLLDVVIQVDFVDERKFADAAAARAKTGAEIVNLTYRSRYVEDPDGQWQGYSDTDPDRAWGVDGWGRRAGQGAYFDWVMANALIPAHDPRTGLQKIDRTTVTAINTIAAQLGKIQSTEDDANSGLNPVGLSADVVPFDFDPLLFQHSQFSKTHFEQMAERAELALQNAVKVFDHANKHSNRLREQATTTESFSRQTYEQDRDYRNRLIEIFGTPYSGMIGTGKAYPAGYNGPDLSLYMYVDVNDISSDSVPGPNETFRAVWNAFPQMITVDPKTIGIGTGSVTTGAEFGTLMSQYFLADVLRLNTDNIDLNNKITQGVFSTALMEEGYAGITSIEGYFHTLSLEMNLPVTAGAYTFQAPAEWGRRSSPGELQSAISSLVQAQAELGLAVGNYDYLVLEILYAAEMLRAQHGVLATNVQVTDQVRKTTKALSGVILGLKALSAIFDTQTDDTQPTADAIAEFFPRTVGFSNDVTSGLRGLAKTLGVTAAKIFTALKIAADAAADGVEIAKDDVSALGTQAIEKAGFEFEIQQKLKEIELQLYNESSSRVEVFQKLEAMRQASDRYRAVLQKGLALVDERADFNRNAAGAAQKLRYQDMSFRVFRNDALQKYRAAFDLAARYAYLAAKAYDYETNLSLDDPASARGLLQEIIRARTLGVYDDGPSNAAAGLSRTLATLRSNYEVLKGRMGLNNPQTETTDFSLRREHARTDAAGWRQLLQNSRKADLWTIPEFRRYCRPPVARSAGKLPGLVISFSSETMFGRNFFGRTLAAGDNAFNPTNFANKIASIGVSFDGYPIAALAATPQAYLVPAGLDVMTIPNSGELRTRVWNIVDQALPVPFPVSNNDLTNPNWVPVADGLSGPLAEIRRFSSFRAGITAGDAPAATDTRLVGRSVWNTNWLLIIPGGSMLNNGDKALDHFINSVSDIKLHFSTYGYSGN